METVQIDGRRITVSEYPTRKSSEAPFPHGWPGGLVCYFTVKNGVPQQLRCRDDMRAALARRRKIYATWPGQWSTDLFVIDDPQKLPR